MCKHCPRHCGVNRNDKLGFCHSPNQIILHTVSLHFGEEPIISGKSGSAAFFFSGCTLRCAFCQNWQISHHIRGKALKPSQLAELFMQAQQAGAHNINLVSATQYYQAIIIAIEQAHDMGLHLPIAWNSGGYEQVETIEALKAVGVNIFLPDFKFLDAQLANHYTLAVNYPTLASQAILAMVQDNPLTFNAQGMLESGVIMRHLVLPDALENSKAVLQWFAKELKGRALLSLMTQYTPVHIPNEQRSIPMRGLTEQEEIDLIHILQELEIDDGFFQDLLEEDNQWLPNFEHKKNPFSEQLAKSLWHWQHS